MRRRSAIVLVCLVAGILAMPCGATGEEWKLHTRVRSETETGSGKFRIVERAVAWNPRETAIVVCDMWDRHWCQGATARVAEMAPRMNEVLKAARARGVLILHCPSDTMKFYEGAPQRKIAQAAPRVETDKKPAGWCPLASGREPALPFDNSRDRCDCEPQCPHGNPWRRQIETLEIAPEDAIADSTDAYYLMRERGIRHVIVMGVHTNMCVLGRPFSIRQMCGFGQDVVLCRDLTDSMHDSLSPPVGLDHFRATDLVVEHIEKYWCPTILSTDFLGGAPFAFAGDRRPHVVFVVGEDEYETKTTLPRFADEELASRNIRTTFVHASESDPNDFPGLEALDSADLLVVSVRRRTPPTEQLARIKAYLASGKPVVGIRTASHAFALRDGNEPPAGHAVWPEFDGTVLGGHYTGHHGNKPGAGARTLIWIEPGAADNPLLQGFPAGELQVPSWLYKTSPVASSAKVLLRGRVEGKQPDEPVAWTYATPAGNRVFYTSLGHPEEFAMPAFRHLLTNGIVWALGQPAAGSAE
ncbi:MAG: isochorismatase family protein [Planctomycetaceae bacterium]|nr:isochorismatase family protein [Planctomycetaceae bacterium]